MGFRQLILPYLKRWSLVMGCDQNLRELSMNVILRLIMWVKREICKWQFSQFLAILSEKFVNFSVISLVVAETTWIGKNRILQFKTEVKQDSVKRWKLLLSVNFPWTWFYWPITSAYHLVYLSRYSCLKLGFHINECWF